MMDYCFRVVLIEISCKITKRKTKLINYDQSKIFDMNNYAMLKQLDKKKCKK